MRVLKKLLKGLFWLLILVLLLLPLYWIYQISKDEMRQYDTKEAPVLQETAYGSVTHAFRTDMWETLEVSGEFVSNAYEEMTLDYKRPDLIHWSIQIGSEIQGGQVIGTYQGEDIVSTLTGTVVDMHCVSKEDCYLRIQLYQPLALRCALTQKQLFSLQTAPKLTLFDGTPVTVSYQARRRNPDGTTTVELSFDSEEYAFGQVLQSLALNTGRGYPQALVLDKRCVYQRTSGADEPWYVREVTENGYFIQELEVKVGLATDTLICVTGVGTDITEDMYFDTGYKALLAGEEG